MREPAARLHLSSPGELIEAVPYVLGYHPDNSLVGLALRGGRGRLVFTVRVDLPPVDTSADTVHGLADAVAGYLSHARADQAVLVVYGTSVDVLDGFPHRDLVLRTSESLSQRRVQIKDALYVAGGRWWSYRCDDPTCCPSEGTAVRPDAGSPVAALARHAGLEAVPDRAALERMLEPISFVAARGMQEAIARANAQKETRGAEARSHDAVRGDSINLLTEGLDRAASLTDDEAAALLIALDDRAVRDACCKWVHGEVIIRALTLWLQLARRAVPPYDTVPLFLVAWFAWHSGKATLARIALDRCLATNPGYRFALLLQEALDRALNPAELPARTLFRMGAHRSSATRRWENGRRRRQTSEG